MRLISTIKVCIIFESCEKSRDKLAGMPLNILIFIETSNSPDV